MVQKINPFLSRLSGQNSEHLLSDKKLVIQTPNAFLVSRGTHICLLGGWKRPNAFKTFLSALFLIGFVNRILDSFHSDRSPQPLTLSHAHPILVFSDVMTFCAHRDATWMIDPVHGLRYVLVLALCSPKPVRCKSLSQRPHAVAAPSVVCPALCICDNVESMCI